MTHADALKDYQVLQSISGGDPHDSGQMMELIADDLLKVPSKRAATNHLIELIHAFFEKGNANGNDMSREEGAREVFRRQGLIGEDDD
jgi:hypothetical protein